METCGDDGQWEQPQYCQSLCTSKDGTYQLYECVGGSGTGTCLTGGTCPNP
jgi:hypothetical protein